MSQCEQTLNSCVSRVDPQGLRMNPKNANQTFSEGGYQGEHPLIKIRRSGVYVTEAKLRSNLFLTDLPPGGQSRAVSQRDIRRRRKRCGGPVSKELCGAAATAELYCELRAEGPVGVTGKSAGGFRRGVVETPLRAHASCVSRGGPAGPYCNFAPFAVQLGCARYKPLCAAPRGRA